MGTLDMQVSSARLKQWLAVFAIGCFSGESVADRGVVLAAVRAIESRLVVLRPADLSLPTSKRRPASGILIDCDGLVLASLRHTHEFATWDVVLADGRKHQATTIASSIDTDVALIQLEDARDLPVAEWTNHHEIEDAMDVLILGVQNPEHRSICRGLVSGIFNPNDSRKISLIRIDSSTSSPLGASLVFDLRGRIVGYVPDRSTRDHGNPGAIMAIAATDLQAIVDQRLKARRVGKQ